MQHGGAAELREHGAAKAQWKAEGIAPERGREASEGLGRPSGGAGMCDQAPRAKGDDAR
jgi:hypothetical protein